QHVTVDLNGSTMRVHDSSTNGTLAGTKIVNNGAADVPMGAPLTLGEFTIALTVRPPQAAPDRIVTPAETPRPEPPPPVNGRAPADAVQARAAEAADEKRRRESVVLRREIHRLLLEHLDLATVEPSKLDDPSLRPKVLNALRRIVKAMSDTIPADVNHDALIGDLADEAVGL